MTEVREHDVRKAVDDLLGWAEIARSPQLGRFLSYIVEAKLRGASDSIKAYAIAVDVFGRPPSFDPQRDPIVRVQARRLRALLDQYYESAEATGVVRVRLPLGRYVPDFEVFSPPLAAAEPMGEAPARPRGVAWQSPALRVGLALLIVAVLLAGLAYDLKWFRPFGPGPGDPPQSPQVLVGGFSNLSGIAGLDRPVGDLAGQLADGLARFPDVRGARISTETPGSAAPLDNSFVLTGAVRRGTDGLEVSALLSSGLSHAAMWTAAVVEPLPTGNPADGLRDASNSIIAQLTRFGGPLHKEGRAWLANQFALPAQPSSYACMLQYRLAGEAGRLKDAAIARACFALVLRRQPHSAIALAGAAGLDADAVVRAMNPGDVLSELMASVMAEARRAEALAPSDSFEHEQLARVLAAAGRDDEAGREFATALRLNPANIDARAGWARFLGLSGDWPNGAAQAQVALDAAPPSPPWYFLVPALGDLREQRDGEALTLGLLLGQSDTEFGPVIALIAGQRTGGVDLVRQFLPAVLDNADFRRGGILPRLGLRLHDARLLQVIGDGLALAGVPQQALTQPF